MRNISNTRRLGVALTVLGKDEDTGLAIIKVGEVEKTISLSMMKYLFY